MKITKDTLKQLIKEELGSRRSDDDKESDKKRGAAITADIAARMAQDAAAAKKAADQKKYGGGSAEAPRDRYETTRDGQKIVIDMLTKLTDMVEQLLQKP